MEILASKFKDNFNVFSIISKILLISLILRASAYFISPYPVGSDPWAHAEYIKYFLQFQHLMAPPDYEYYRNYPLAHLLACAANLIGDISIKESMFIIGAVLALSTIFVYLIVKKITNNINLALLSMLLLNFAGSHIQWSIEVIAMTFGIAVYAIIIYLILRTREKHQLIYISILILFIFVIIWTHTVSGFIAFVSVISLYVGSFIYQVIYVKHKHEELVVSLTFCMIFVVILGFHWMDPDYPFIESITIGLVNSLSAEAEFLGRLPSITQQQWESLPNILGFLVYIFFGIVGSLCCLSRKYADKTKVSLIFMLIILYFVFFVFPVFGMRNIMPGRWPAFIYVSFVLFVGIGLTGLLSMLKSKNQKITFVFIVLFITSFFMMTTYFSDMDSPVYGQEIFRKNVWTESEMTLFKKINDSYDGMIVADLQTGARPFRTCLQNYRIRYYRLTSKEEIDYDYMNDKLVVWRKMSLSRPVLVGTIVRHTQISLGSEFENHFDENFSCIYNTGEARAYLGRSQ